MISILAKGQNRAILPAELRVIQAYTQRYRNKSDPFDIVVILWSEGNQTTDEFQTTATYAEAGVTWWLEDLSTERFSKLNEVRNRLRKGPPSN